MYKSLIYNKINHNSYVVINAVGKIYKTVKTFLLGGDTLWYQFSTPLLKYSRNAYMTECVHPSPLYSHEQVKLRKSNLDTTHILKERPAITSQET